MWTRAELIERAKACLRKYYWAAFAVSLVFSLVSGIGSPVTQPADSGYQDDYYEEYGFVEGLGDDLPAVVGKIPAVIENVPVGPGVVQTGRMIYGVMAGVMIVFLILALVLGIFVIPVIAVGHNRYYMESRLMGRSAGFGKLLWGFSRHYLNIVLTMFLRDLIIVGGTFLCVLPGLYFAYCYYMVPYILAENPEMKPMEALRLSKQMMEGHKMNTWLLEMSFFGWMFLGAMACGVGTFFVLPYYYATFAELYAVLRAPYGGELNGFGYPEVVPTGSFGGTYVNQADSAGNGQYGGYGQTQGGADYVDHPQGRYGSGGICGQDHVPCNGNEADAEGSGVFGGGQSEGASGWTEASGQGAEHPAEDQRDESIKRSEGGPGRGYYLNGVFHPYSEEEDN